MMLKTLAGGIFLAFLSTAAPAATRASEPKIVTMAPQGEQVARSATGVATAPAYSPDIGYSISEWRRLRRGGALPFEDYARFLINDPGWPGETAIRSAAEKAMRAGENPSTVLAFYASVKPKSGNGWMRYIDALAASGQTAGAAAAAEDAWASPSLSGPDSDALIARFGQNFTAQDHDRRLDALLFAQKASEAARLLWRASGNRQQSFTVRLALQSRAPDAEAQYQSVAGLASTDAGLMMDRVRYLIAGRNIGAARLVAARPHRFASQPADPDRWYEMLLLLAKGAVDDREWQVAYDIASQVDDAFPAGTEITSQAFGIRDKYTSLAWLAGRIAGDRLNRPADAAAMFSRYARGGRSLQVATKGNYWAGRAAAAAGQPEQARQFFSNASAYPELFYGQLALERLGLPVTPPRPLPSVAPTDPQRGIFANNRLALANRMMDSSANPQERLQFVRALGSSLNSDTERVLAMEFSRNLRRPDIAVWVGREARGTGNAFYVKDAFPASSAAPATLWSLTQAVTRQESSFDPYTVSPAGAQGMMQLMPGTAREQAQKAGLTYEASRVIRDPDYNVMIGSSYFQYLLTYWQGSIPLAVASYNAGMGNVRKWINANGDPRSPQVDVVEWIEAIPFSETSNYVQRVIENSVVYDSMHLPAGSDTRLHVSRYLGKSNPG